MKYLLTGGAGFIGSHLSEFLQSEGHEVIIIDDFSTGSFDNINVPNHVSVENGPHVIAESVTNFDILNDIVPQVDYVFHLAAVVGVKLVLDKPIKTIETNVEGTQNVLKAANKYRKPVMIFSTYFFGILSMLFTFNVTGMSAFLVSHILRHKLS